VRMTTKLRGLLKDGMVIAASCYDPFTSRLAVLAGFEAIHLTGFGLEATMLGAPDLGLVTMSELTSHAARMTSAVEVPIVADVDTGFGSVMNVHRTIREMERAGVAGVHIEDQALPKRCPLLAGRRTVSRTEALDRLKAALDARTDPDFVIVARTDTDTVSYEEVVERCHLFLEAGADLVMPMVLGLKHKGTPHGQLSPEDSLAFSRALIKAIGGPVMNTGASPPKGYTVRDLAEVGFAFTFFVNSALGAAANAVAAVFKEIRETGNDTGYIAAHPGPYHDALAVMRAARLDHFVDLEKRFSSDL